MKKNLTSLIVVLMALVVSIDVLARPNIRRVRLEYYGQQFRSRDGQDTLYLKRKFRRQKPRLAQRLLGNGSKLKGVIFIAKTKHGRGMASLKVGRQQSYQERIDGHPGDFFSNDPYTYFRTRFENPNYNYNSQGVWQVKMRGNFKVKAVVLLIKTRNVGPGPGPGPLHFTAVSTFKADKFIYGNKTVNVNRNAKAIRLSVRKNVADIRSVRVVFGNGSSQRLYALEGNLSDGRSKTARIGNRYVRYVEVVSSSRRPFGNRARVTVSIGR